MCRWLVYKGDRITLEHLLFKPQNALMHQARHEVFAPGVRVDPLRNSQLNADGYGVAWYDRCITDEPATFKTVLPAWNDLNLRDISMVVQTTLLLAHVRAASPPAIISRENCHPFKFGRFSFMHNGGIAGFRLIRRQLLTLVPDALASAIHGTTDSEHAFALFLSELGGNPLGDTYDASDIAAAIERTVARILELQLAAGVQQASSLNFAVTDGRTVVATRFRNSMYEEPPSLYYSYGSEFQMRSGTYRMGKTDVHDTVIISSEPLTYTLEDWTLVPANHLVIAHPVPADHPAPDSVADVTVHPMRVEWHGRFAPSAAAPGVTHETVTPYGGGGEPLEARLPAVYAAAPAAGSSVPGASSTAASLVLPLRTPPRLWSGGSGRVPLPPPLRVSRADAAGGGDRAPPSPDERSARGLFDV